MRCVRTNIQSISMLRIPWLNASAWPFLQTESQTKCIQFWILIVGRRTLQHTIPSIWSEVEWSGSTETWKCFKLIRIEVIDMFVAMIECPLCIEMKCVKVRSVRTTVGHRSNSILFYVNVPTSRLLRSVCARGSFPFSRVQNEAFIRFVVDCVRVSCMFERDNSKDFVYLEFSIRHSRQGAPITQLKAALTQTTSSVALVNSGHCSIRYFFSVFEWRKIVSTQHSNDTSVQR